MLAGSYQAWTFTFTLPMPASSPPYPITDATWEYVARTSATDTTEPPLIEITTSVTSAGLITITDSVTVSSALLAIYPAATATLAPGTYYHSLWMNPATASAYPWFGGPLLIAGNPQP